MGSRQAPPAVRDRIRDEDSRLIERVVVLLLAFWMGTLLLAALAATGSFAAVDSTLSKPPAVVAKALERMGPDQTRELLHYHSGEVNRGLFETFGWLQLGLTAVTFTLMLFLTNAGKRVLGLAALMAAMSGLITFYVIPGMVRIGREMRARPPGPTPDMSESFQTMHRAFAAFEVAAVLLAILLMAALLRGGARARR
jgi:hypothetical protein